MPFTYNDWSSDQFKADAESAFIKDMTKSLGSYAAGNPFSLNPANLATGILTPAFGYLGSQFGTELGSDLFGKTPENSIGSNVGAALGVMMAANPIIGALVGAFGGGLVDALGGGDGKKRVTAGWTNNDALYKGGGLTKTGASGLSFNTATKRVGQDLSEKIMDRGLFVDSLLDSILKKYNYDVDFSDSDFTYKGHGEAGHENEDGSIFGLVGYNELDPDGLYNQLDLFSDAWLGEASDKYGVSSEEIPILKALERVNEDFWNPESAFWRGNDFSPTSISTLLDYTPEEWDSYLADYDQDKKLETKLSNFVRRENASLRSGRGSLAIFGEAFKGLEEPSSYNLKPLGERSYTRFNNIWDDSELSRLQELGYETPSEIVDTLNNLYLNPRYNGSSGTDLLYANKDVNDFSSFTTNSAVPVPNNLFGDPNSPEYNQNRVNFVKNNFKKQAIKQAITSGIFNKVQSNPTYQLYQAQRQASQNQQEDTNTTTTA